MIKQSATAAPSAVAEVGIVAEAPAFDAAWGEMHDRLARVLAARGVPAQDREDLLQETALRLYRVWETLDPAQPVWPYAVTIALNLWRDGLRAAAIRVREVAPVLDNDAAADHLDVERTVIARQELAHVGEALRELAPEQRRLVLETDEITAVVRPLRAAERMSRMRVRRELARVVGRASAVAALFWLRRHGRAQAMTAAAFTGALAVTVFGGSPAVSVAAAPAVVSPAPVSAGPLLRVAHPVAHVVAFRHAARLVAARSSRPAVHPDVEPALVCAPTPPPAGAPSGLPSSDPGAAGPAAPVTVGDYVTSTPVDPSAVPQPVVVTVPTAHTSNDGCVTVD